MSEFQHPHYARHVPRVAGARDRTQNCQLKSLSKDSRVSSSVNSERRWSNVSLSNAAGGQQSEPGLHPRRPAPLKRLICLARQWKGRPQRAALCCEEDLSPTGDGVEHLNLKPSVNVFIYLGYPCVARRAIGVNQFSRAISQAVKQNNIAALLNRHGGLQTLSLTHRA